MCFVKGKTKKTKKKLCFRLSLVSWDYNFEVRFQMSQEMPHVLIINWLATSPTKAESQNLQIDINTNKKLQTNFKELAYFSDPKNRCANKLTMQEARARDWPKKISFELVYLLLLLFFF